MKAVQWIRKVLKKLVEYHIAQGTDALVAVGTSGESATLDEDEHLMLSSLLLTMPAAEYRLLPERVQTQPLKRLL